MDRSYKVSDRQMARMALYLLHVEGLFVGSSAAANAVAALAL